MSRAVLFLTFFSCVLLHLCASAPAKKSEKKDAKPSQLASVKMDPFWPVPPLRPAFGQIGGVSIDGRGNIFIFHRVARTWDPEDFNEKFSYVRAKYGAIEGDPIVALDPNSKVLLTFGAGRFYLPHGIFVDNHENVWVTDVALHQVLKFEPGKAEPTLSLGESLIPGSDDAHFCQPTAVAVATTGEFFVADGYCNSRIMKFAANGTLISKWGRKRNGKEPLSPEHLSIPHGLALSEERDLICTADREHRRIVCWHAGLKQSEMAGKFAFSLTWPGLGRTFDVKFNDKYGVLLILATTEAASRGYVVGLKSRKVIGSFESPSYRGFGHGHSLASAPDGRSLAVGSLSFQCPDLLVPNCRHGDSELDQNLWRFELFSRKQAAHLDREEEQLKGAASQLQEHRQEKKAKAAADKREKEEAYRWMKEWAKRQE